MGGKRAAGPLFLAALAVVVAACRSGQPSPAVRESRSPAPSAVVERREEAGPLVPNAHGRVMILAYHRIGQREGRWERTPQGLRSDLEALYSRGYRPVNAADYALGQMQVPRGYSPVVLTFDDGTEGQFRLLPDGRIDPDSAVGVLVAFHQQHPDWPLRATFFVNRLPFGQPDSWAWKVRWLLTQGFEVGDHTLDHADLSRLGPAATQHQLAGEVALLRQAWPHYEPLTMALPYGSLPAATAASRQGREGVASYRFAGIFLVGGGPAPSPWDPEFDRYRIPRIQVTDPSLHIPDTFSNWLAYFDTHPERRYVSPG